LTASRQLEGGPVHPALNTLKRLAGLSARARKLFATLARTLGERRAERLLRATGRLPVEDLWRLTDAVRAYGRRFLAAMDAAGIDVIVCPVFATPAMPHGFSRDFAIAASSSMLFNLTQLPAGVIGVTRVRGDETRRADVRDRFDKRAAHIDRE